MRRCVLVNGSCKMAAGWMVILISMMEVRVANSQSTKIPSWEASTLLGLDDMPVIVKRPNGDHPNLLQLKSGDNRKSQIIYRRRDNASRYEHLSLECWPRHRKPGQLDVAQFGNVTGIGVDAAHDSLVVFHYASGISKFDKSQRHYIGDRSRPIPEGPILWVDPTTGIVRNTAGKNIFFVPHGLHVDHENNIWVTDVALHQVLKFSPCNEYRTPVLTFGEKFKPGADTEHLCGPTDVVTDRWGNVFIADGTCNRRILKLDKNNKLVSAFNIKFNKNVGQPHTLGFPHSLSLDPDNYILYITDRTNNRVLACDGKHGTILSEYKMFGKPLMAVHFSSAPEGGIFYVVSAAYDKKPGMGFTYSLKTNSIVDKWGPKKGFHKPHNVFSTGEGANRKVYVTEIVPPKLWKFNVKKVESKQC